jgi:phosphate transport system substrate-binding protein
MRINLRRSFWALFAAVFCLAACGTPATQAPAPTAGPIVNVTLAGSGGGTTILKSIVQPFEEQRPDVTLAFLQGSGGGPAKKGVAEEALDVAILLSPDIASEKQDGLELLPLADDPIAFVVHASLPIERLTAEQLKAIYLGKITNWRDVGGPDAAIVVLTRDEDEGSTKVLRKTIFTDATWAASAVVLTKAGELRDAVTKTPNSIGFGSYGDFVINGLGADVIAVDDVHPKEYGGGRYPIPARTLAVMYTPKNREKVQPLIDYLKSEMAKTALLKDGVVPVR